MRKAPGSFVYLSSVSSIGPAWPGIGVYTATKAALNRMVDTLRLEHTEVGFTRVFVGPTDRGRHPHQLRHERFPATRRRCSDLAVASGAMNTPGRGVGGGGAWRCPSDARIHDVTVARRRILPLPWAGVPSGDVPAL